MRKMLPLFIATFMAFTALGQGAAFHYIKFLHVGERIMPVHTLNITSGDGVAPTDSTEIINDTLKVISVATDEASFKILDNYVKNANFRIVMNRGLLNFGTFKIIRDGNRFYLPDFSVTKYFKKMVATLKSKKADPALIQAIEDNYPWIFNP
jgi:hypothetical protein